jgi:two-component system, cell cycle sensor histidine kinase and response regulator CckA
MCGFGTEIMASSFTGVLETILVVDDTENILNLVVEILETANFHVLQANSGVGAVTLAAGYSGKIDLLLSDVDMPEMSGPELGDALKQARPDMHVMFMSGFTGGDLLVLNYGWAFIDKPFVPRKLVEMINAVLHSANKSQGNHGFDSRKDNGAVE